MAQNIEQPGSIAAIVDLVADKWATSLGLGFHNAVRDDPMGAT